MKGRKPKSVRVKERDGNPGRRRLRVVEGGGGSGKPPEDARLKPPGYLDRVARAEWRRLVPLLLARRQYIDLFQSELAKYCVAFSQWRAALEKVAEGAAGAGLVQTTPSGYLAKSAWLTIADKAGEQMGRIAADFGFNPVAQMRLEGLQLDMFDQPAKQAAGSAGNAFDGF